jgi:outer membrane biosynthesis protein TonB
MRSLAARVERQRLGALGIAGSALLHASLVVLVLGARRTPPSRLLPAYRVDLVAAPRAAAPQPSAATASAAPAPAPPAARPAPRDARRETAPARRTPPAPAVPASAPGGAAKAASTAIPAGAAKAPVPLAGGAEGAVGGTGSDPATIRTEGVEFPFPGYLRNLVAQVYRRWQPPTGNANLEAEVLFLVHRDGTISGLTFVRRSGSFGFDLEAQGAIEAAARANAFGQLPSGYGADVLPLSFYFSPRSLR